MNPRKYSHTSEGVQIHIVQMLIMITSLISTAWLVRVLPTASCWTMAGEKVFCPQSRDIILAQLVSWCCNPRRSGFENPRKNLDIIHLVCYVDLEFCYIDSLSFVIIG
jgi:hypothetical protein